MNFVNILYFNEELKLKNLKHRYTNLTFLKINDMIVKIIKIINGK
jgi:hypothetical protein